MTWTGRAQSSRHRMTLLGTIWLPIHSAVTVPHHYSQPRHVPVTPSQSSLWDIRKMINESSTALILKQTLKCLTAQDEIKDLMNNNSSKVKKKKKKEWYHSSLMNKGNRVFKYTFEKHIKCTVECKMNNKVSWTVVLFAIHKCHLFINVVLKYLWVMNWAVLSYLPSLASEKREIFKGIANGLPSTPLTSL